MEEGGMAAGNSRHSYGQFTKLYLLTGESNIIPAECFATVAHPTIHQH